MHRNDESVFLLYIEPKTEEKLEIPINDELTKLMEMSLDKSSSGAANYSKIDEPVRFSANDGWRGWHGTDCGKKSSGHDHMLQNGMIVNSLCVFYIRWYRNSIHENDWKKLKKLGDFYDVNIELPETFPYSPESTRQKTPKEKMNNFEDVLIKELAGTVDKNIIKEIKEMGQGDMVKGAFAWMEKNEK